MVMILKKGSDKKSIELLRSKLVDLKPKRRGIDAYKYCGVITLQGSPVDIQKNMRSEWE